MRRALEYTIHDRELQDTRKKLTEMESKRKNSGEEAERLRNALQDAQDSAKAANKEVKDLKLKENAVKEESVQAEEDPLLSTWDIIPEGSCLMTQEDNFDLVMHFCGFSHFFML